MRFAAFNTGPEFHALDHIAPLADLFKMPLFVTEERNYQLAKHYYPQVDARFLENIESNLSWIADTFDVLFECKYWAPHLKSLFHQLFRKEMRLVFCPHGQSDKGFKAPLLAPYAAQDIVLLYGPLLIEMLKELHIWPLIKESLIVGNYRLQFYQKNRPFYNALVEEEIPIDRRKQTLLYAPTWKDADDATSFFHEALKVIREIPSDWNLILKVHPLLEQRDPAHFYRIAAEAERKENVFFIHECPLIYPILERADFYLGDASSVGYDFLYFERPLYFFSTDSPGRLRGCGRVVNPAKNLYLQLEKENVFRAEQKELYQFAFNDSISQEDFAQFFKTRTATCS